MTVRLQLLLTRVIAVPSKQNTIKCSSMKSGVFPFALHSSRGGVCDNPTPLYPHSGPVHKQTTMNKCCQPLEKKPVC